MGQLAVEAFQSRILLLARGIYPNNQVFTTVTRAKRSFATGAVTDNPHKFLLFLDFSDSCVNPSRFLRSACKNDLNELMEAGRHSEDLTSEVEIEMRIQRIVFGGTAAAMLLFVQSAARGETAPAKDIVATAIEAGSFKTLAAALQAAGLVETLQGKGPFTVFAPTDEAFAKLPAGTVDTLLKPENKKTLIGVLTYHVVPGKLMASNVIKLKAAATVNGQRVNVKVDGDKVQIDDAQVSATDIVCSNGVIHVIDHVILPSVDNIPATAEKAGTFKTLLAAAKAAGLVEVLSGDKPLTVFAPTDDAFAKLPDGTVENLLKPENKEKLAAILKFHVVAGRIFSNEVLSKKELKTVQGGVLNAAIDNGAATINGAGLVATDIDASNGVIHVIDTVMLPVATPAKGAHIAPATSQYVAQACQQNGHVASYRMRGTRRR